MGDWADATIGDVCEVVAGQSPKGINCNDTGDGLPFYQGKKKFGDKYIGAPEKWTTQITREAYACDILMSVRAPVGPINFATEKICIGRGLAAIRSGEQIHCEFLFYALLSMQEQIQGNEGAVFASINKKQIESIPIPLPPLPEQERIVAILDEAFAAIATATANAARNLANARELFESHVRAVFRQKRDGWRKTTLGESCEFHNGKAHEKHIEANGEYIVVNSKYISSGGSIFKRTNDAMFPLSMGDIVMVMSDVPNGKALAKCSIIDEDGKYTLNQRICAIRSQRFESRFLFYHLNRHRFLLGFDNGENQTNLRKGDILRCPLFCPPLEVQDKIGNELEAFSTQHQLLEHVYKRKATSLTELKQSILHKAFTGELTANPKAADHALSEAGV